MVTDAFVGQLVQAGGRLLIALIHMRLCSNEACVSGVENCPLGAVLYISLDWPRRLRPAKERPSLQSNPQTELMSRRRPLRQYHRRSELTLRA